MKKIIMAFTMLLIMAILASSAFADGGYFPRNGWVVPGQQDAVILFEDNTETMVVTSSFRGSADDLVWIIPTPTKPQVTKASEKVITNAMNLAMPKNSRNVFDAGYALSAVKSEDAKRVLVLETKQVDYYDIKVLYATSSRDLVDWFNENDYTYPEEYSYVLESYINKGWYFTAIKVSASALGSSEVIQDTKSGHPTPIKLVFLSDKIVFPLKISSVEFPSATDKRFNSASSESNGASRYDRQGIRWSKIGKDRWQTESPSFQGVTWSDELIDQQPGGIYNQQINPSASSSQPSSYTPINLYVFADSKYLVDGLNVRYGNWVKKKQIKDLGYDDSGSPYLNPTKDRYYFTYLSGGMQKNQMDDDLVLRRADSNLKVNAGPGWWQILFYGVLYSIFIIIFWLFSPVLGMLFVIGTLINIFSKSKPMNLLSRICQVIPLVITGILTIIISFLSVYYGSLGNYIVISVMLTGLLLLVLMLAVMFIPKR